MNSSKKLLKNNTKNISIIFNSFKRKPNDNDNIKYEISTDLKISLVDSNNNKIYGSVNKSMNSYKYTKLINIPLYSEYVIKINGLFDQLDVIYFLEYGIVDNNILKPKDPIEIGCYQEFIIRGLRLTPKGSFIMIPQNINQIIELKFIKKKYEVYENKSNFMDIGEYIFRFSINCI